MENYNLPRHVKVSDNVLFQDIEGECVLLNMDSELYFGLDGVGTRVWQLLSENSSTENAVEKLVTEFEVDKETVRRDLAKLLDELKIEKLVAVED